MKSTNDLKVPEKIIEQVIGQDEATEIMKKAALQRRHVLLIGEPGTGKSMLGFALAELLPKSELKDILALPNPHDENNPQIQELPAGKGREEAKKYMIDTRQMIKNNNLLLFAVALLTFIAPWWVRQHYNSDLMFTAFFLGGMLFLAAFSIMMSVGPRMFKMNSLMTPKVIVDNFGKKEVPFFDATGAHAGALLGDVLHDPYQSGGLGTPANQRIIAGLIHKAHLGVIFIDEIATLDPRTQQELLSAVQEKKFPITGQSERSAGAMVRTDAVPCFTPETKININDREIRIGDYIGQKSRQRPGLKINENQEIFFPVPSEERTIAFNGTFQADTPLLLYKTKYQGEMIELELEDGKIIQATPEHPFLTEKGLIPARDLSGNEKIAVYQDNSNKNIIINEIDIINTYHKEQQRVAYAYLAYCKLSRDLPQKKVAALLGVDESTIRSWKQGAKPRAIRAIESLAALTLCPLSFSDKRLALLAKISGVLFGDGGIARNRVYFSTGLNAQEDIDEFINDVVALLAGQVKKRIHVRNTGKGLEVSVNSASLARLFMALDVPKNDKVNLPFSVPRWIYNDPQVEKNFFSALISAELYGNVTCISDQPDFVMAKLIRFEREHLSFLKEIQNYLYKNKIKVGKIKKSTEYLKTVEGKRTPAAKYSFSVATSHEDLLKFLTAVNVVYANQKKHSLEHLAKTSRQYLENQERRTVAYQQIDFLRRKGDTILEIARKLKLAKNTVWKRTEPVHQHYSRRMKREVCQRVLKGETVKSLAQEYGTPIPTIRYWLKNGTT